jgi:hypothetical protein
MALPTLRIIGFIIGIFLITLAVGGGGGQGPPGFF